MELTSREKEEVMLALSMRCGYIETGTVYRAKDLEKAGQREDVRALSTEQMRLIILLEDLMSKIINS